jgi:hypothetical protein
MEDEETTTTLLDTTTTEDTGVVDATTDVEGATLEALVDGATAEDEERAAQISPVTCRVVAASAVEQLDRTQDSAPLVMACWLAGSH